MKHTDWIFPREGAGERGVEGAGPATNAAELGSTGKTEEVGLDRDLIELKKGAGAAEEGDTSKLFKGF